MKTRTVCDKEYFRHLLQVKVQQGNERPACLVDDCCYPAGERHSASLYYMKG